MRFSATPTALALAAALTAQACASAGGPAPSAEPAAASTSELEALYRARRDSALLRVSPADVDFMTGMIHHHAQALVMSGFAPGNGASPSIRTLAARITNAQKDEIANMQTWLRDRGRPVPEVDDAGAVHMAGDMAGMHGDAHAMHMPGMLTAAQMGELEDATGVDFDRLFLTYMIQHHEGAVTMVHDLFAVDGAAQDDAVFKIASDIQVDQITEINRMRKMLEAMDAAPEGG